MKTCSFRGAKPRSVDEDLFCVNEPSVRYSFSRCHNCELCLPTHHESRYRRQTIQFNSQKFRFTNGYETILNCPASCPTCNVIYAMTCPCIEFEYIGETSQRLGDRLWCKYLFFFSSRYKHHWSSIYGSHRSSSTFQSNHTRISHWRRKCQTG